MYQINPWLIATISLLMAAFFAFVIERTLKAHRRQASTGREELIGKTAIVRATLEPEGIVFVKGERWAAVSETGLVEPGEEVKITKIDGLKLYVTKKE